MEKLFPRFSELFAQLGLSDTPADIEKFLTQHRPLAFNIRIQDAAFWTPTQASLLQELLQEDANWAEVVDQLSLALRPESDTPKHG
jgi:hypothetical protein